MARPPEGVEPVAVDDGRLADPPAGGPPRATRPDLGPLVVRARRRDPAAVDELVRALASDLGPVCGAIALDDGDDALQEALLQVLRSLDQLREPSAVRGWARRIAVREAVRIARRRARTAPLGHEPFEDGAAALAAADAELTAGVDHRLDVVAVLRRLDPAQRAVLVLRHLHGLDEREVAEVLDVPIGTVKSRASRARDAFAGRWRP